MNDIGTMYCTQIPDRLYTTLSKTIIYKIKHFNIK